MFQQSLITQQIFLPVQFAIELAFFNPLSQASMMNEMPTTQLPQKCLLPVRAHDTLQLLNFNIQFFALDDVPSGIFAEIARQSGSQEVAEPPCIFQLGPDEALLAIQFFLHLPIFAFPPFLLGPVLADEGMLDMSPQLETALTKCHIFTVHALINGLACSDFPQLTPVTVVVIFLPNFFVDLLLLEHILFFLDLPDDIGRFFISAERAFDYIVVLHLMLGPLAETLEVKGVSADSVAGGGDITFDDLHVADGAEEILVFVVLFEDDIFPEHFDFGVLEELFHFILVDSSIRNNIPQFFIIVFMPKQQWVVLGHVKNIGEGVEGVQALLADGPFAGALQLVADGYFEFGSMDVFEDKGGAAGDPNQVVLHLSLEQHFNLLHLELQVLLCQGFRHTIINIIYLIHFT